MLGSAIERRVQREREWRRAKHKQQQKAGGGQSGAEAAQCRAPRLFCTLIEWAAAGSAPTPAFGFAPVLRPKSVAALLTTTGRSHSSWLSRRSTAQLILVRPQRLLVSGSILSPTQRWAESSWHELAARVQLKRCRIFLAQWISLRSHKSGLIVRSAPNSTALEQSQDNTAGRAD